MHKNAKTLVILIDIFLYGVLLHSLISCVPKVVSVSGLLGFLLSLFSTNVYCIYSI